MAFRAAAGGRAGRFRFDAFRIALDVLEILRQAAAIAEGARLGRHLQPGG